MTVQTPIGRITLRDAFALVAFARLIWAHKLGKDSRTVIALDSYACADEAIKARRLTRGGK